MQNKIYLLFLGVFISICTIVSIFGPINYLSVLENRYLNQFPEFTLGAYLRGDYQESLEKAFGDQFIYREKVITIKSDLEGKLMNIFDPVTNINSEVRVVGDKYLWNNQFYTEFETPIEPSKYIARFHENNIRSNAELIKEAIELGVDTYFYHMYYPVDYANNIIYGETITQTVYNRYIEILGEENVTFVQNTVDLYNYTDYYYLADHHFTPQGQVFNYNEMLDPLLENYDLTSQVNRGEIICINNRYMTGSQIPAGNSYGISDPICFNETIYNNRENVYIPITYEESNSLGHNEDFEKGRGYLEDPTNYGLGTYEYVSIYGELIPYKEYTFYDNLTAPNALFITDSNFSAQDIYLASNFYHTVVLDTVIPSNNIKLTEVIQNSDIDILYITLQRYAYDSAWPF